MACEDFPCCGHEAGDCEGLLYGSDEAIKADALLHFECEHYAGFCAVDEDEDEEEPDGAPCCPDPGCGGNPCTFPGYAANH